MTDHTTRQSMRRRLANHPVMRRGFAHVAVGGLIAVAGAVDARAQSAPPPVSPPPMPATSSTATPVPGIVVVDTTADRTVAKRNRQKQALRRAAGTRERVTVAPRPNPAPTEPSPVVGTGGTTLAVPGIVLEGEKVVRPFLATTTSVGVVTGDQIRTQQIRNVTEALNQTANVTAPEGTRGNSGFNIRGINSEGLTQQQNSAAAPVISIVVDGATQNPEASRRGARALWDVEQVEVLRGPQSTLQARNSLAGSVFVKTNDPTYALETAVEGTAGTNSLRTGGFVLNVPIAPGQMAVRLAGQASNLQRGITYTDPENDALDKERLVNLRGKLLIEPDSVPGLSLLLTIVRTEDRPGVTAVTGPDFFARRFELASSAVDFRDTRSDNYISDVSYQLMPAVKLRSVTALAETETDVATPPGSILQRPRDRRSGEDFTQDVRLEIAENPSGLSGVIGVFFGRFGNTRDALLTQDFDRLFGFGGIVTVQDLVIDNQTTSSAVYADLRYRFLERFQLIGGGRILRDEIESSRNGEFFNFDTFTIDPLAEATSSTFNEALPKIGVTFDLTKNQTVGFTYSKGYRAGFTELTAAGVTNTVAPEFLDSYEISYRSRWLNNRLEIAANAFRYEYQGQQVAVDDPAGGFPGAIKNVNAGSSVAHGGEVEVRWRPTIAWQVFASLGLIQTEFESFVTADGDFSGNEFPEAPAVTFNAGVNYKDPSGWFVGANVRYIDGYFSNGDLANDPLRFVDSYTVVDGRVGYTWGGAAGSTTVTVFAKNAFDEQYLTSKSGQFAGDPPEASVGDKRLIGLTVSSTF